MEKGISAESSWLGTLVWVSSRLFQSASRMAPWVLRSVSRVRKEKELMGRGLHVMACALYKHKGFNRRFELTYSILGLLLSFIFFG
jgi:hypothetical protein